VTNELEIAAAASVTGVVGQKAKHARPLGSPCANCATPLMGPWCYACGQLGEDFHRSIIRLLSELVEAMVEVDGRIWRTLPDLMFRPGRLTRSFLDGHRAPQIPPLRLFLVVLVLIFLVGGMIGGNKLIHINRSSDTTTNGKVTTTTQTTKTLDQLTQAERADVEKAMAKGTISIGDKPDPAATNWFRTRITRAIEDPNRFYLVLAAWSERFAFLMLPVSTVLMSLVFIFQRRFYLFDHTIFSLHSLSAMGLLVTVMMGLGRLVGHTADMLLFLAPVHLFVHLRGVYGTSIIGTLIRMWLLLFGATIAAGLLVVALLAVGLNGMG
jgi:hypothetical protein